jgi:hypothetical protein
MALVLMLLRALLVSILVNMAACGRPLKSAMVSAVCACNLFLGTNSIAASDILPLTQSEIAKLVADDIVVRQALITADFSQELYSTTCVFQDEIDKYKYNDYITGTKRLFNAKKSHVDLVGDVSVNPSQIEFKFSEDLTFNLPFNPKVHVSGRVELTRDDSGRIVYSREYWDESVQNVLKTVQFS